MSVYQQPRLGELTLILVLGFLQPAIEMIAGEQWAAQYNVAAALIVVAYLIFCLVRYRGVMRAWGLRFDNLLPALKLHMAFALVAGALVYGYGWLAGTTPLPATFWYLLALYPVWGMAQQFALQNLLAQNLTGLVPNVWMRSIAVALLFGVAHLPSIPLTLLAFSAGFFFTYLYHLRPNLFAVGIAHGIVGSLVFYLVLGADQWEVLRGYIAF